MPAKAYITLAFCLLSACSTAGEYDSQGNLYPPHCRGDLTEIDMPTVAVPPAVLSMLNRNMNRRQLEAWLEPDGMTPNGGALVDVTLPDWAKADARKHAACHSLTAKLYPSTGGQWHR